MNPNDKHFVKNTAGISVEAFFWGLGLPIVMESTFLPLFLRKAGASSFMIGFVPTILFIGLSVFPLFASYLTAHIQHKRNMVILLHILTSSPVLLLGIFLSFFGTPSVILFSFFTAYGLFAICLGLMIPVWQNYIVKIFSEKRRVGGISIMMLTSNIAKISGSFFLTGIIEKLSLSLETAGMIFILVGIVFLIGSVGFFITKESPDIIVEKKDGFFNHFKKSIVQVIKNRNFLLFLANDIEFYAIIGILAFYGNFATEYCAIAPAFVAGLFMVLHHAGSIISNIVFGWIGFLNLKNKCICSKFITLLAILLLVFFPQKIGFLLSSFLLGSSKSIRLLIFPPAVKKISGLNDTTPYFAIAPLLTLPISIGISLTNGKLLDLYSYIGGLSYKIIFAMMGILVIISMILIYQVDFSKRTSPSSDGESEG